MSRRPLAALRIAAALLLAASAAPSLAQSAESLAIRSAIAEYQRTGVARVMEVGQTIIAPYNLVDPVLKTALLRTTLVELDRNEFVVDRFIGDSLRWSVEFGVAGEEGNFRQIVSIKPRDQDVTTSLVLTTNTGRIYQFTLDSEPYPIQTNQNPVDIPYTARVRFYYPDDAAAVAAPFGSSGSPYATTLAALPAPGAAPGAAAGAAPAGGLFAGDGFGAQLRTDYDVRVDPRFPCAPTFVGDDGTRLIVRFPDHTEDPACSTRFPLYAVGETGELQLLNYSVMGGNTYLAERIPDEARILFLTDTGETRQVQIRNRGAARRPGRALSGLTLEGRLSSAFPSASPTFRAAHAPGLDAGLALGARLSRAFSVVLQGGTGSLPTNAVYVGSAVEAALNQALAPALAAGLVADGAIAPGESVMLFSQALGGQIRTLRVSIAGRLSLAPGARVEPYVGARIGVLRRSTSPVALNATGLVVAETGLRRTSPALDAAIRGSFAGTAPRSGSATQTDPAYRTYTELLSGRYGSEYELPGWLLAETSPEVGPEIGASLGLLIRATSMLGVFVETEYGYSPVGDRLDRATAPLSLGLRADL